MSTPQIAQAGSAGPVASTERITNLDAIRGFAVLGILVMNAVAYGLPTAAYFNLDAQADQNWLDWIVGGFGEIFVDQKTMGLFSMLFGAGIVLFADRAASKGRRPVMLSLWRNLLLLGIGYVHGLLWEGDVLTLYAVCAPLLVWMRKLKPRTLVTVGTLVVLSSALGAVLAQPTVHGDGQGLGSFWFVGQTDADMSDAVGLFLLTDFFVRAFGMMLIGVALYRSGILHGAKPRAFYVRMAKYGLGIGLPLAALGLAIQVTAGFSPGVAVIGEAPNTVATIPVALGYIGLIVLWNQRTPTRLHHRIRAAGRMALTNYLTQTIIGIVVLRGLFAGSDLSRSWIALFVITIWALQLAWSEPWLERFAFGPFEWLWRCGTYRRWQTILTARRPPTT